MPIVSQNRLRPAASLVGLFVVAWSAGCGEPAVTPTAAPRDVVARDEAPAKSGAQEATVADGRALAAQWCASCHLLPAPADLPRAHWPLVMRWMGNYLGHPDAGDDIKNLIYPTLVATESSITRAELAAIERYYLDEAPEAIEPAFSRERPLPATILFKPVAWPGYERPLTISLVKIDAERRRLYVGSVEDSFLRLFAADGQLISRINCSQNQAIDVRPTSDGFDLALIGDIGKDRQQGTVHKIVGGGPGIPLRASRIVTGFYRTSGADWGDLDGDGYEDVVMAGFGDYAQGALSWFSVRPERESQRHDLRVGSGALDAVADDVDGDGDRDVLSMVAQGHQEAWWYENDGVGKFTPHRLWKERSALGYNGFQWFDFDGDGRRDVIAASGNNMEMPDPPLKSLHGVYVYLQTGPMAFTPGRFLRMDGVAKALAGDYDGDGDNDVAAISAYPDWRATSPAAFVLFTNNGGGQFTASTLAPEFSGQPITMDAGDLDGDGDIDVVIGGASWPPALPEPLLTEAKQRIARAPSVVLLRNQSPRAR